MCLGVPGKVVAVNGLLATVDFWGRRKQVRLEVVDEPVQPGDYILNHVGYAIRRIPPGEIDATLDLVTKIDLLPHLPGVRLDTIADALSRVMPQPVYIPVSVHTGEGIDRWVEWLERLVPAARRSILTLQVE